MVAGPSLRCWSAPLTGSGRAHRGAPATPAAVGRRPPPISLWRGARAGYRRRPWQAPYVRAAASQGASRKDEDLGTDVSPLRSSAPSSSPTSALSPNAAPFHPGAGRSKARRWADTDIVDTPDSNTAPISYLDALRRASLPPRIATARAALAAHQAFVFGPCWRGAGPKRWEAASAASAGGARHAHSAIGGPYPGTSAPRTSRAEVVR